MTTWTIDRAPVGSAEALALLREYLIDVSDSYYQNHFGRSSTPEEIETGLAAFPSDHLGVFLIGRYDGVPAACAGLCVIDAQTVELSRMFVRKTHRGTGGGALLLAAVEQAAHDLGADRIVLDTRLDLVEARGLYVKHGYAEAPAHNDKTYAEIWYSKELGTAAAPVTGPGSA